MIGTKFNKFIVRYALCASLGALPALAQNNAPVRDPKALALLAQCALNMGTSAIGDFYATGTITRSDSKDSPGTIVSQIKGVKMRNDITFPDGLHSYATNGTSGWNLQQGKRAKAPYAAFAYYRPEYVPALACVIDPLRPRMNVQQVGLENVGINTAYHLEFSVPPSGSDNSETMISDFHVFLDQQTLVVLKTRTLIFDPAALENHSVWETYYSDYRLVSGALVPFHIENYLSGQKVNDIVFSSVQLNTGIPDGNFD